MNPTMSFDGGSIKLRPLTLKGEASTADGVTISKTNGGTVTYRDKVAYKPEMKNATVSFNLNNASDVKVVVTDLAGNAVYTNNVANAAAGKYEFAINTNEMAAGVYTVNFTANNTVVTKKLVIK